MTPFQHAVFWAAVFISLSLLLYYLGNSLAPFFFGIVLAYILKPAADYLEKKKCPRTLAAVLLTLCALLAFVGIFLLLAPLLLHQGAALVERIPAWLEGARLFLAEHIGQSDITESLSRLSQSPASTDNILAIPSTLLWGGGQLVINLITFLFIFPIVTIYVLRDWNKIFAKINSLLPREDAPFIRSLFAEIDSTISIFLRGQMSVCLVLALFYAIAFSLIGIDYGLLIGIFSGFISFIPYAGALLAMLLAPALALLQFWPDMTWAAAILGFCLLGQILESYFLTPRFIGDRIGLHPLWILFALAAFGSFWGFTGLLLAIPAAATLGIALSHTIGFYKESVLYHQRGEDSSQ